MRNEEFGMRNEEEPRTAAVPLTSSGCPRLSFIFYLAIFNLLPLLGNDLKAQGVVLAEVLFGEGVDLGQIDGGVIGIAVAGPVKAVGLLLAL